MIIVDVVDEIPNNNKNSLMDLIPKRENLSDGVYILLNFRTPKQSSEYTKNLLKTVTFDKVITVDEKNEDYRATLKNFIAAKTKASENIVDKIFETAEGRALSLENIIRAYLQRAKNFSINRTKIFLTSCANFTANAITRKF